MCVDEEKPKNWNFIKAHSYIHTLEDILAMGTLMSLTTKLGEKLHGLVRKHYLRNTNFKNVEIQVLIILLVIVRLAGWVLEVGLGWLWLGSLEHSHWHYWQLVSSTCGLLYTSLIQRYTLLVYFLPMADPPSRTNPPSPISILLQNMGLTRDDLAQRTEQMREFLDTDSSSLRALSQKSE